MTLITLALSNLKRHRARTMLTTLGVIISAATLFSILSFDAGYEEALKEEMASTGTHLFVSTEGCPSVAATMLIRGGEIPRYMKMSHLIQSKRIDGVKAAGGFLIFTGIRPEGGIDLFFGITKGVLNLKTHWQLTGTWFNQPNDVILGADLAEKHKAKIGSFIRITSIGKDFRVVGILKETHGQDDHFYYLPIETAQNVFRKQDKLTAIGVRLEDVRDMARVKSELEKMPEAYVVPAEQMSEEIMGMVGNTKILMVSVVIIALLVSGLGLMNTVLMATLERQTEFAYFRCVGACRADLIKLVMLETMVICLAGLLLGFAAGYGVSSALDIWIRDYLPYAPAGRLLRPNVLVICISILVVLVIGAVAAIYPSWRAAGVSPMEAIRNG